MASIIVPNGIGSKSASIGQRIGFTKIRYFEETDTLLIDFREASVVETGDLDENTIRDVFSRPSEADEHVEADEFPQIPGDHNETFKLTRNSRGSPG